MTVSQHAKYITLKQNEFLSHFFAFSGLTCQNILYRPKIDLLTKYVRSPLVFLDSGYFMKFDTSSGNVGNSAMLESRILYPKRGEQCLQFFYKMTGAAGDRLVIWTRADDGTGNITSVKKIHSFTGILFCQSCDN